MSDGIKAVDLLAINPDGREIWLIEAKDYRRRAREKESPLYKEIFLKVLDTLAALLPAAINAYNDEEKEFAIWALKAKSIHIVFHGEQPARPSKLFPRSFDKAELLQKLRQMFKPIDPRPLVASVAEAPARIPWRTRI